MVHRLILVQFCFLFLYLPTIKPKTIKIMKDKKIDALKDNKNPGQYTIAGNMPTPKKNENTNFSSCPSSKFLSIK